MGIGNNGDEQKQQEVKICPFNEKDCMTTECALWMYLNVQEPGMAVAQKQGNCAFVAAVKVGSSPKVMIPPPQKIQGIRGLPGIPGL